MNVSVSVRRWKQTTSSRREQRAPGRLSELICPRLNPPPVPGWEGEEVDGDGNEEHLHLNGMFFFLSPSSLYLFGNDLVMCWWRHERKSSSLLLASRSFTIIQVSFLCSLLFYTEPESSFFSSAWGGPPAPTFLVNAHVKHHHTWHSQDYVTWRPGTMSHLLHDTVCFLFLKREREMLSPQVTFKRAQAHRWTSSSFSYGMDYVQVPWQDTNILFTHCITSTSRGIMILAWPCIIYSCPAVYVLALVLFVGAPVGSVLARLTPDLPVQTLTPIRGE